MSLLTPNYGDDDYCRLDSSWYHREPVLSIPGAIRPAAIYLQHALTGYSRLHNSDGVVKRFTVPLLIGDADIDIDAALAALEAAGLATVVDGVITLTDYLDWQDSAASRAEKSSNASRAAKRKWEIERARREAETAPQAPEPVTASPDGPQQPEPVRTVEPAITGGFSASLVREHWHPSRDWDQAVADRFVRDLDAAGVTADCPEQVRAKAAEAVTGASDPSVAKVVGWWVRALPEKIADGKKAAAAAPVEAPEATFEERAAFGLALMGLDKPTGGAA